MCYVPRTGVGIQMKLYWFYVVFSVSSEENSNMPLLLASRECEHSKYQTYFIVIMVI